MHELQAGSEDPRFYLPDGVVVLAICRKYQAHVPRKQRHHDPQCRKHYLYEHSDSQVGGGGVLWLFGLKEHEILFLGEHVVGFSELMSNQNEGE